MREKLKKIGSSERHSFTVTVKKYGTKRGFKGHVEKTILFKDVTLKGKVVAEHVWAKVGKIIEEAELKPGDIITLNARVMPYMKGYKGHRDDYDDIYYEHPIEEDYKLAYITKIVKIGRENK
ncbi:MAG: hypothetical protein IJ608_04300 [Lachnospiraceae bacterium]|nr:hypothetical protein [Lachnospiraceae bacterium]